MRTLEESKMFPIIAWTTVILFAVFTIHLALSLQNFTKNLDEPKSLEQRLQA